MYRMSGWRIVTPSEASTLEHKLSRAVCAGHLLAGRAARARARRVDCDDVVFEVAGTGLCLVHVTWKVETDAGWPRVESLNEMPTCHLPGER